MATPVVPQSEWRDRKRYLWILGLGAPSCALFPSQLVLHTGITAFWWLGPIVVFGLIPLLDILVGEDGENPPESAMKTLAADRYYRWCTYLFLPILFASMAVSCWLWAFGQLSVVDKLGLACTLGVVNGIGINAAHELGHRAERYEQVFAKIALAPSGYGHFFVEHNRGHHANVATPEDPASSRFGESLWEFLPRTVTGSFRSAWRLERARLNRLGHRTLNWRNHILHSWAISAVMFGGVIGVGGVRIIPYLIVQALIAIFLLETVNYVEHYGLLREKRPSGKYERCSPRHSWNSDRLVTNIFLFHLQRHSDHHANPQRRYQTLRSFAESPQLPAGYATMVLLAAVPPLWRRVMDPRVLAHYDGDITRANLVPRLRRKFVADPAAVASAA
jgi:alkane 1-monooxygenase